MIQTDAIPCPDCKQTRWMLYLSPVMFLIGSVAFAINLCDWVKAPSLLWASSLISDSGFVWFGAAGYDDAKYTLRTGIARRSAARMAGFFLIFLGKAGRHTSQHTPSLFLPPWLLGSLVLVTLYGAAWAALREWRSRTEIESRI